MPRRKSLIAQMYEAHQKAKLQRQKEEERLRRECGRTGKGCGPAREGGCSTAPGRRTRDSGQAPRGAAGRTSPSAGEVKAERKGPEAFVEVVQRALATSVIQRG